MRLAIRALAAEPRPRGAALLAGTGPDRIWRIRVGDYRVLYEIQDDLLVVLVVRLGHRREIYRGRGISEASAPYATRINRPQPHGGRSWSRDVLYPDQARATSDPFRPRELADEPQISRALTHQ